MRLKYTTEKMHQICRIRGRSGSETVHSKNSAS